MSFIRLEIVQRRVQATGEAFVTPLAFPVLNVFVFTAFAITNECMDDVIGDAEIVAFGIGASMPIGGDAFLAAARAFALRVRNDIRVGLQNGQREAGLTA